MIYLLDVNVLIALAWPSHIHHSAARTWFSKKGEKGWATCPMTQCAFVRISSNPKIIVDSVSPADARSVLSEMTNHRGHVFWPDSLDYTDPAFDELLVAGHRQVTDGYLLLLAAAKKGMLATFDRSIGQTYCAEKGALVELIG